MAARLDTPCKLRSRPFPRPCRLATVPSDGPSGDCGEHAGDRNRRCAASELAPKARTSFADGVDCLRNLP
eukprot:11700286-Alexandrium_andersonii.AAC.1